jgi:hypothetical protein
MGVSDSRAWGGGKWRECETESGICLKNSWFCADRLSSPSLERLVISRARQQAAAAQGASKLSKLAHSKMTEYMAESNLTR